MSQRESLSALWALKKIADAFSLTADLTISRDKNGKPHFLSSPLYFNLSHSNGLATAIISDNPVGIDIELIDPNRRILSLAKKYFSAEEYNTVTASPSPYKDFYKIWTKEEAFSKIHGEGLSQLLSKQKKSDTIGFFKQYVADINENQYILSICFDKRFDEKIILLPYKELNIYELQN